MWQAIAEEKVLYRTKVANSSAKYGRVLARTREEVQELALSVEQKVAATAETKRR